MPILKNAKKALRASQRKTVINTQLRSKMKTAIDEMKKSPAADKLSAAFSAVDRSVKKNIVQKNKAARVKASLSKLLGK
ncbi:MAG: 30S ribosomal protein S20 [Candidatus Pacebacteria bacterium GW2011_GWF2_38_9]|nr:MAG: 30S ribosomal protein S20, small subunit ribosomal protein S20 [candidate division TM6 bacterium GW2011_GWF2_28_16]KKQ09558.1 MAG: 30S ribosomal protein S20 [Candidatus Pacebacteria bacterium GW2011_GWF1_36_5]KKQ88468.1 MAG: 30S ribosomal protein S20 [Candidatus Pacebacteria bacterium GW2011_GWF2_38_9]MBU1033427.1 30S ribosomal protein S20 [Patescibacteria group bacterium]HAZ73397.1 30S ribosomal protein S20 [Candidatus Paceibacterota bacterium]